jgi:hypothetical protein
VPPDLLPLLWGCLPGSAACYFEHRDCLLRCRPGEMCGSVQAILAWRRRRRRRKRIDVHV